MLEMVNSRAEANVGCLLGIQISWLVLLRN